MDAEWKREMTDFTVKGLIVLALVIAGFQIIYWLELLELSVWFTGGSSSVEVRITN